MLFRQMTFNFSELRVYFECRLRGVIYGTFRAAVKLENFLGSFCGSVHFTGMSNFWERLCTKPIMSQIERRASRRGGNGGAAARGEEAVRRVARESADVALPQAYV